ncbi:MAG: DUF5110 domain-containing protein [Bacteroidales bacterium]|nr:DUF5110 domain-containing protein [Bacteroidales bacterium]
MFKKIALTLATAALPLTMLAANGQENGVVYKDKHVRFTVVADGLVRMEYQPNGKFVDDNSFIAVNRNDYEGSAKVTDDGKNVTISTPKLTLNYVKSKGPFTAENLTITSGPGMKAFTWHPGMEQKENLMGTTETLDRWDGDDYFIKNDDGEWERTQQTLEKGLLARDGWTLIDDSEGFLFDNNPEIPWVKVRKTKKDAQDWYFLSYGDDYKSALKDFSILSGQMALPPRFAFGYWWSRWWAYSEHEFRQLIQNFEDYQIPIDILIVDMDWHYTDEDHGGWTGWTWNRRLFPEPERFLNYLRDKNLKIALNLHPADGVKKYEAAYPEIAKDKGIDPKTEVDIPWISSDSTFVYSMFKHILNPMTDEGVSFWWLDWQQDPTDEKVKGLSNIWWLNHTFFNKMKNEQDARPLIYHRWGGLGNHRYQIGFSGDSYATWKTLDYMPYFTSTASNVLYGYWCHDLGGFYMAPGDTVFNPEMYVRFFQFGAYSPMMKTHSGKNATLNKEPWNFDRQTLSLLRNTIQRRYEMIPYIYTMARKSHDTAVSICRPMYYDYPTDENAYTFKNQYMYGDNMLVAPVTTPAEDGYATVEIWLPEGQWYEDATGTMLEGNKVYKRKFNLSEVPVYIKAGSILPYHVDKNRRLTTNDAAYSLNVYPMGNGEFTIYEDNGNDKDYEHNFATTKVTSTRGEKSLKVNIAPRQGSYKDMPATRQYQVKVLATLPPEKVTVDGVEVPFRYIPQELAAVVELPEKTADNERTIIFTLPENAEIVDGTIGNMRRFVDTFAGLKDKFARLEVTEDFGPMSIIYEAIEYAPDQTTELLNRFRTNFADLERIATEQPMSDSARQWFLKGVGI